MSIGTENWRKRSGGNTDIKKPDCQTMAFCPFELQKTTVNQYCASRKHAGKYICHSSKAAPKYQFRCGSGKLKTTDFLRHREDSRQPSAFQKAEKVQIKEFTHAPHRRAAKFLPGKSQCFRGPIARWRGFLAVATLLFHPPVLYMQHNLSHLFTVCPITWQAISTLWRRLCISG